MISFDKIFLRKIYLFILYFTETALLFIECKQRLLKEVLPNQKREILSFVKCNSFKKKKIKNKVSLCD